MDRQSHTADHGGSPFHPRTPGALPRTLRNAYAQRNVALSSVLFGAAVALLGLGFDYFLVHEERLRSFTASLLLNVIFGAFATVLVHRLLAHEQEKRARVMERLAVIDEMNHHIRNALQVIAFKTANTANAAEVTEITLAVDRIQWSLREVLPRIEPEFAAFEGSARKDAEAGALSEEPNEGRT